MDLRRAGGEQTTGQKLSRRDVRARRLHGGTTGRRLSALQAGKQTGGRSYFQTPQRFFRGRVDPRPSGEQLKRLPSRHMILREHIAKMQRGELRENAPAQIRTLAVPGTRKTIQVAPLCSKTDGVRRINCLIEYNIEINEQTADAETLEIWERMQRELR